MPNLEQVVADERVLIVEDDPLYRRLLELTLKGQCAEVLGVASAEAALDVLDTFKPTLFFVDLTLPGMGGLDLCRQLRGMREFAQKPILLLTAADHSAAIEEIIHLGMIWYLRKGASHDHLMRTTATLAQKAHAVRVLAN